MYDKVMGRTRTCFTEAYAQSSSADCDLDIYLTTSFLHATHRVAMLVIGAKQFLNPTTQYKVMGQTQTVFTEAKCEL